MKIDYAVIAILMWFGLEVINKFYGHTKFIRNTKDILNKFVAPLCGVAVILNFIYKML